MNQKQITVFHIAGCKGALLFLLSLLGVGTVSADSVENYSYTLYGTSGLGTLCFPATVPFWEQKGEGEEGEKSTLIGFRAFKVSGIDGDVLNLSEISRADTDAAIPENTPVIVYWPYEAGMVHAIPCGSVDNYPAQDVEATTANLLGGTTHSEGYDIIGTENSNFYIMQDHGTTEEPKVAFYQCSGKKSGSDTEYNTYKVGRFHCWLDLSTASDAMPASLSFAIDDEDSTAGIDDVKVNTKAKDGIYTLNGSRIDNPVHGKIYLMVMDGKAMKIIIK